MLNLCDLANSLQRANSYAITLINFCLVVRKQFDIICILVGESGYRAKSISLSCQLDFISADPYVGTCCPNSLDAGYYDR